MKEKWSSVYYDDVTIHRCQSDHYLAKEIILKILDECNDHPKNWFQNSWRPSVGWICSIALGVHFIILPLAEWAAILNGVEVELPQFDFTQLSAILMSMLGMSGLRSYDKQRLMKEKKELFKK